jgi:hypothetical protein
LTAEARLTVVAAWLIVCVIAVDVLVALFASPLYTAVMVWVPTPSVVMESEALPLAIVLVPNDVAPSRNWTVPVAAAGETVAVKLTDCP